MGDVRDACVVHQDVQAAPGVERGLNDFARAGFVGDAVRIGNSLAAGRPNLVDDLFGVRPEDAAPVGADAEIVDHDLGAAVGEQFGVRPTEAGRLTARTGHDGDLAVESHLAQCFSSRSAGVDAWSNSTINSVGPLMPSIGFHGAGPMRRGLRIRRARTVSAPASSILARLAPRQ